MSDKDMFRVGRCRGCRKLFAWTGLMATVPDCSCGRKHTQDEFLGQEFGLVCREWLDEGVKYLRSIGEHQQADNLQHGR